MIFVRFLFMYLLCLFSFFPFLFFLGGGVNVLFTCLIIFEPMFSLSPISNHSIILFSISFHVFFLIFTFHSHILLFFFIQSFIHFLYNLKLFFLSLCFIAFFLISFLFFFSFVYISVFS